MSVDQTRYTEVVLDVTPDAAVISNLGTASYHLIAVADRPRNFHFTGAMGATTPFALGLAMAIDDFVTVLDGDGSTLMSLGAFATVAKANPPNFTIVVMDNGTFETTGGQPTLSTEVDFAGVAKECGLTAWSVDSVDAFESAYSSAVNHDGPAVVVCDVEPESPEDHPPLDYAHSYTKHRFRREFVDR